MLGPVIGSSSGLRNVGGCLTVRVHNRVFIVGSGSRLKKLVSGSIPFAIVNRMYARRYGAAYLRCHRNAYPYGVVGSAFNGMVRIFI